MIASIPIVWRPMPMAGRPHVHHLPAGLSLAEMVAAVPDLPADFRATAVICLDGEQVPRELWPRLRVRPDARRAPVITLHRALRGGAGGKGALAIVATIAAAVIAPYAAPWALAGFSAATGVIIPMGAYATAVTLTTAAITLGAAARGRPAPSPRSPRRLHWAQRRKSAPAAPPRSPATCWRPAPRRRASSALTASIRRSAATSWSRPSTRTRSRRS